jgi:CheY-like chemotaxis protein
VAFLDFAMVGSSVLVVDEAADLRRVIETALKHAGYEVQTADNGDQALELCNLRDPDVILVDIDMPVVSGPAFVIAYRAGPTPNARIIVMSSHAAERSAQTMACDFGLSKPFSLDEVIAAVRYLTSSTPVNVSPERLATVQPVSETT